MEQEQNTSSAKIEANRRNSLRSTGPKTPGGKRVVRWNALKHGLLSKEVGILAGDGKESKTEYQTLLEQLQNYLEPGGILEEILVEKIAVCYWRLRRVLRCEMGEIRRGLDTVSSRDLFRRIDQVEFEKRFIALEESRQNLKHTSLGLQYLIGILEEVRPDVEEVGYLSEEVLTRLTQRFGADENGLAHWCWVFSQMATEGLIEAEQASEREETPSTEQCKAIMLDLIEEEKKKLMNLKEILEENEQLELEAKVASLYLPSREAIEKFLRYETAIERQLYRAMSQLERLQRQRQGDFVPLPISVDLSNAN
jgi:hypothetical protein